MPYGHRKTSHLSRVPDLPWLSLDSVRRFRQKREKAVSHSVRKHVPCRRAFSVASPGVPAKERNPYLSRKESDKCRFSFKPRGPGPSRPAARYGRLHPTGGATPLLLSDRAVGSDGGLALQATMCTQALHSGEQKPDFEPGVLIRFLPTSRESLRIPRPRGTLCPRSSGSARDGVRFFRRLRNRESRSAVPFGLPCKYLRDNTHLSQSKPLDGRLRKALFSSAPTSTALP